MKHIVLPFPSRCGGPQLSFPKTGGVRQHLGGYIAPAPWQEAVQPPRGDVKGTAFAPGSVGLQQEGAQVMEVRCVLLLVFSAGKRAWFSDCLGLGPLGGCGSMALCAHCYKSACSGSRLPRGRFYDMPYHSNKSFGML